MKMSLSETSDTKHSIVPDGEYVYVSSSMKHNMKSPNEDAFGIHSISYTTLFFWHLHDENPAIQTQESWPSCFLLLWTSHLEFPQDTTQPCHLLKPNWKPSSTHSICTPAKFSTQFML